MRGKVETIETAMVDRDVAQEGGGEVMEADEDPLEPGKEKHPVLPPALVTDKLHQTLKGGFLCLRHDCWL